MMGEPSQTGQQQDTGQNDEAASLASSFDEENLTEDQERDSSVSGPYTSVSEEEPDVAPSFTETTPGEGGFPPTEEAPTEFEEGFAPAPPPPPPPVYPETLFDQVKNLLPFVLIALFILGIGFFLFKFLTRSRGPQEVTLTYWGLWEEPQVTEGIIKDYQKIKPKVKINYSKQNIKQYRLRLQNALEKGSGPDIFRFHNTWAPMLKNDLSPIPKKIMSVQEYEEIFYPVTKSDLKIGDQYFGIPLEFDGLALFYNEEIFKAAGTTPPTTWEELQEAAINLTVKDENTGEIITAGVALGTANNIEHWSDILGLMFLQSGIDLKNPNGQAAEEAFLFYSLFAQKPNNTWDETLDNSILAFASGRVAMIFAPSWQVFTIQAINPNLDFKIISVPQLPGVNVTWASYWVEGVSVKSKFQTEAWEFLKFLSENETLVKLYTEESKLRLFGEPYSRKDLAPSLQDHPFLGAYIKQAPFAQSWYLSSRTHDEGINDKIINYYADAVNSLLKGSSPKAALETVSKGVTQVLSNYGLVAAPAQ